MTNSQEGSPEVVEYPKIVAELEERVRIDQEMRTRWQKKEKPWDEKVDKTNTERMKEIVAEIGWPTRTKVGEEGMKDAWLLVQHADRDVEFQKQCLELMKLEDLGEVRKGDIAYLTDRVRVNEGKLQVYGSQFNDEGGVFTPKPIEDVERVDERRKEMELGTLEEGIAEMYEKYKT
jgi:hypothetical protein